MKENVIQLKAYAFAIKIVQFCDDLEEHRSYVLSKQLLKSGTSIGANAEEGLQGQSRADFISKLSIAHKEAFETRYWLRLIRDAKKAPVAACDKLLNEVEEIIKILTSILKTSKAS